MACGCRPNSAADSLTEPDLPASVESHTELLSAPRRVCIGLQQTQTKTQKELGARSAHVRTTLDLRPTTGRARLGARLGAHRPGGTVCLQQVLVSGNTSVHQSLERRSENPQAEPYESLGVIWCDSHRDRSRWGPIGPQGESLRPGAQTPPRTSGSDAL